MIIVQYRTELYATYHEEMTMTRSQAVRYIRGSKGQIIHVAFIKRTTGELRYMLCRTGVKSYLRGGQQPYDAKKLNLITVFDMRKQQYRTIPIEGLCGITVRGKWEEIR